jgi:hypothetical protein
MSRNDDDAGGVYKVDTVPPPAGSGDAYSAPTKVGPMTSVLVQEMMHAAKAKADAKAEAKALEKKLSAASAQATARNPRFAGVPIGAVPRAALGPPIPRVDAVDPPEPARREEPIFTAPNVPADIAPIVAPIVAPVVAPIAQPVAVQPVAPVLVIDALPEFPLALSPLVLSSPPSSEAPPAPSFVELAPSSRRPQPPQPAPRAGLSFGRVVLVAAAATLLACGLALVTYIALTRGWHVRVRF